MNWYRKVRHSDRLYWIVITIVAAELVFAYGMILGFWFTGPYR